MQLWRRILVGISITFALTFAVFFITRRATKDPNTYLVTFNSQGGTNIETQTIKHSEKIEKPEDPKKADFIFSGWYEELTYTNLWNFDVDVVTSDITLYAKWLAAEESKYYTVVFVSDASLIENKSVLENTLLARPVSPLKEGYTFSNWYLEEDYQTLWNFETDPVKSNLTLYAKWEINSYNITYNLDEGENSPNNPSTYTILSEINLEAPTKNGYVFKGFEEGNTIEKGTNGDLTFTAIWQVLEYNITYDLDGGENSPFNPGFYTINDYIVLQDPTRKGHAFIGWQEGDKILTGTTGNKHFTALWSQDTKAISFYANGGTGDMPLQNALSNSGVTLNPVLFDRLGYSFLGWALNPSDDAVYADGESIIMNDTDISLYAVWKANINSITFRPNGGEGTMNNKNAATDETDFLPLNAYSRQGYIFKGWAENQEATKIDYTDGEEFTMSYRDLELYAVWEAKTHTIRFYANGGEGEMSEQLIKTDEETILHSNNFTKEGYTFAGWSLVKDEDIIYLNQSLIKGDINDLNLYAKWLPLTLNIYYDANGGEGLMITQSLYSDETIKLSPNIFTKAGYIFRGWSTSPYGAIEYTDESSLTIGHSDITLYAIWEQADLLIIFNSSNASGSMPDQVVKADTNVYLDKNEFVKAGYTFAGWSLIENGLIVYLDQAEIIMETANIILYAKWLPNDNLVIFHANSGIGSMPDQIIKTDKDAFLNDNLYTKEGYTFSGWALSSTGAVVYSNQANITMETESIELFAIWQANLNKIVFIPNGGTGNMGDQNVRTHETTALDPNSYIRAGYNFLGWSLSPIGTTDYLDGATINIGTQDINLYALWEAKENILSFNSNNATGSMADQLIHTDETVKINANAFTKTGYTFVGWSTTPDGSLAYYNQDDFTMGAETTVLFAIWQAKDNNIYFFANTGSGTMTPQVLKSDESANLKLNTFIKAGYTFMGWSQQANGSIAYLNGENIRMGVTNINLYAIWEANNNTIIFNANGGIGTMENQIIKTNVTAPLRQNTFTRETHEFFGWSTTEAGNVIYSDEASYKMGTESTVNLYAVWLLITEEFVVSNNIITGLTEYGKARKTVVIPEEIGGVAITEIANNAFSGSKAETIIITKNITKLGGDSFASLRNLTSFVIPLDSELKTIGSFCFSSCSELASIALPESLTSIGTSAFVGTKIERLYIPKNVFSIGSFIFYGGTAMNEYIVDDDNSNFTDIDGVLYTKDEKTLLLYPPKKGAIYSIPESTETIGIYAFWGSDLTEVTFPISLKTISENAFYGVGIKKVTLYENVSTIADTAFLGCSSITSFGVSEENNYYASLDDVLYTKGIAHLLFYPLGKSDTNYTIPSTIVSIGSYAFSTNRFLTSLIFLAVIPPSFSSTSFQSSKITTISVPESSLNSYTEYPLYSIFTINTF